MRSAAGYYIGRSCVEDGFEEPYSRESGYYPTEEAAATDLKGEFPVRDCVENNYAYEQGIIPRPVR